MHRPATAHLLDDADSVPRIDCPSAGGLILAQFSPIIDPDRLPRHAALHLLGDLDTGARKLALDWSRCDGHGLCSAVAPEIIRLDQNGFPAFPQTPLPPWLENGARKAVNVCPALALRLTEPTTAK